MFRSLAVGRETEGRSTTKAVTIVGPVSGAVIDTTETTRVAGVEVSKKIRVIRGGQTRWKTLVATIDRTPQATKCLKIVVQEVTIGRRGAPKAQPHSFSSQEMQS